MKIIHTFAAAAGIAALAACAPADQTHDNNVGMQEDNVMVVDNLIVNDIVTDDLMMNDMNAVGDMNAMDQNALGPADTTVTNTQ